MMTSFEYVYGSDNIETIKMTWSYYKMNVPDSCQLMFLSVIYLVLVLTETA